MAGLLLSLSQDYADGQLDRETYRLQRAELIDRILNAEEDIAAPVSPSEDVTVSRDLSFRRRDRKSPHIHNASKSGLLRWRSKATIWLVIAAAITVMLIIGMLTMGRGDGADEGTQEEGVVSKLSERDALPAIEVLQAITQSMPADNELDDEDDSASYQ